MMGIPLRRDLRGHAESSAEFDQTGAALGRLPDFDGDHLVPGAADDHADSLLVGRHLSGPVGLRAVMNVQFMAEIRREQATLHGPAAFPRGILRKIGNV